MNFRQHKKLIKELKAFAELNQKRLLDEYNYNIPVMWRYKEYKRIIALQKIFYRNKPFKYLRRIKKHENKKYLKFRDATNIIFAEVENDKSRREIY